MITLPAVRNIYLVQKGKMTHIFANVQEYEKNAMYKEWEGKGYSVKKILANE